MGELPKLVPHHSVRVLNQELLTAEAVFERDSPLSPPLSPTTGNPPSVLQHPNEIKTPPLQFFLQRPDGPPFFDELPFEPMQLQPAIDKENLKNRIEEIGNQMYLDGCVGYPNFRDPRWETIINYSHVNQIKFRNVLIPDDWHCQECQDILKARCNNNFLAEVTHTLMPTLDYLPENCHLCNKDSKTRLVASLCTNCVYQFAVLGAPEREVPVTMVCPKIPIRISAGLVTSQPKERRVSAAKRKKEAEN